MAVRGNRRYVLVVDVGSILTDQCQRALSRRQNYPVNHAHTHAAESDMVVLHVLGNVALPDEQRAKRHDHGISSPANDGPQSNLAISGHVREARTRQSRGLQQGHARIDHSKPIGQDPAYRIEIFSNVGLSLVVAVGGDLQSQGNVTVLFVELRRMAHH